MKKTIRKNNFESEKRYRMWRTLALICGVIIVICVILLLILDR